MERNSPRTPLPPRQPSPIPTPTPSPLPTPAPPAVDRPDASMTGQGKLVFQITTAGGAIPLPGAMVTLRRSNMTSDTGADPGAMGDVLSVLYSGADGKTETLTLPAPARGYSLEPARDGAPVPYALYNADVAMDGFFAQSYVRIPVFDGITSIQRASLIPLPENGFEGGTRPDGERFIEGESPDL